MRVNSLYLSINVPLKLGNGLTSFTLKRSLYGSFTTLPLHNEAIDKNNELGQRQCDVTV